MYRKGQVVKLRKNHPQYESALATGTNLWKVISNPQDGRDDMFMIRLEGKTKEVVYARFEHVETSNKQEDEGCGCPEPGRHPGTCVPAVAKPRNKEGVNGNDSD